jgi:hypothetical protein
VSLRAEIAVASVPLAVQGALFLLIACAGTPHAWTALSPFPAEIAWDLLRGGESPFDGYDGLAAGPLLWGLLEAPWLAIVGRVGLVHALAGLAVALLISVSSWRLVRGAWGPTAGLCALALTALPPPTLWVMTHYGAYYALSVGLVMAGMLALRRGTKASVALGAVLVGGAVTSSFGAIGAAAAAIGVFLVGKPVRAWVLVGAGLAVAALPLLWKAGVHTPWGVSGALATGAATKRFFLQGDFPWSRLPGMASRDLVYATHWASHSLSWAGWLWYGAAVLAVIAAAGALFRRRLPREGVALLGIVAAVFLVGGVTGWFPRVPQGEAMERDGRHAVALVHASLLLIAALASSPLRAVRAAAVGVVVALAGCSVVSQVRDLRVAMREVDPFASGLATPFRLEGRYGTGFFRGPFFLGREGDAVASCMRAGERLGGDCVRGVAMSFGYNARGAPAAAVSRGAAAPYELGEACLRLSASAPVAIAEELDRWCGIGLGWGEAHRRFRQPTVAVAACLDEAAHAADCVRGVGWGVAQDFADRDGALIRWAAGLPSTERPLFAEGVGAYAAMVARDRPYFERLCARLTGPLAPSCRAGAVLNRGFQEPLRARP